MSNLTAARSVLLSQLLDDVVGSEEMVHIRQDFCRLSDCILSARCGQQKVNFYYTGSKGEGLDLPGSDDDIMLDINDIKSVQVIQTEEDAKDAASRNVFTISTENVFPCFVLLRCVRRLQDRDLLNACQYMDNSLYLSSNLYVQNESFVFRKLSNFQISRQGPSIEQWTQYMDTSEPGSDTVLSIHCPYWPESAREWQVRPRKFAWPSVPDIKDIIDFGFHLVPVGHPHSQKNMMEWRMSFSVAERTLVWSFNHVQMQCYAVMKLILKEFINPNCSPSSRILCSYFIKTFLFWKYEEMDPSYWCKENLRQCIMCLLCLFRECVTHGVLRHYFIQSFNLLSVKLTEQAQKELLKILDIIIQSDIRIMKECKTLRKVWIQFVTDCTDGSVVSQEMNRNVLKNDECAMNAIHVLQTLVQELRFATWNYFLTSGNWLVSCENHTINTTPLQSFVMRILLYDRILYGLVPSHSQRNNDVYTERRFVQSSESGIDISTCKLWYAIRMTKCGEYRLSSRIVKRVLSSISPFALYFSGCGLRHVDDGTKHRYIDNFRSNDADMKVRARKAWIFDLLFMQNTMDIVPAAIQVELIHCDRSTGVYLSPFICAYYLMFLNYYGLGEYDNSNRALCQLIDVVNNPEQRGNRYFFRTT